MVTYILYHPTDPKDREFIMHFIHVSSGKMVRLSFDPSTCVSGVLCRTAPDESRSSLVRVGGSSAPSWPKWTGSAFTKKGGNTYPSMQHSAPGGPCYTQIRYLTFEQKKNWVEVYHPHSRGPASGAGSPQSGGLRCEEGWPAASWRCCCCYPFWAGKRPTESSGCCFHLGECIVFFYVFCHVIFGLFNTLRDGSIILLNTELTSEIQ